MPSNPVTFPAISSRVGLTVYVIKNHSASIGEFSKQNKTKKKKAQLEVKRVTTKGFMEKAQQAPIQKQGYR